MCLVMMFLLYDMLACAVIQVITTARQATGKCGTFTVIVASHPQNKMVLFKASNLFLTMFKPLRVIFVEKMNV